MESAEILSATIESARRQLALLQAGDIDAFLEGVEPYERNFEALLDAGTRGHPTVHLSRLRELAELTRLADVEATSRLSEIRLRLAVLNQRRAATNAYYAAPSAVANSSYSG